MSKKPIFLATHPRSCSTAFERVFMTRRDSLTCVHEPFGDAFYYGPERLSSRFEHDEGTRISSGFSNSTFATILERFDQESAKGKRLFIKDMAYYIVPPGEKLAQIAPSLARKKRGVGTPSSGIDGTGSTHEVPYPPNVEAQSDNPTVVPREVLNHFQFTFLIRHPRSSIPSYYRCTIPPLDKVTGFYQFMPSEAGYHELRRLFDYLRSIGKVGPGVAGQETSRTELKANGDSINGHDVGNVRAAGTHVIGNEQPDGTDICLIDADDLLDNPAGVVEAYCKSIGLDYDPKMLSWDNDEDHEYAKEAFQKWNGWHEDAMQSSALKPRTHKKKVKTVEEENREWTEKFGEEEAKIIRQTVDANIEDYEYLKQFTLRV